MVTTIGVEALNCSPAGKDTLGGLKVGEAIDPPP
jgi:hypothetical protein